MIIQYILTRYFQANDYVVSCLIAFLSDEAVKNVHQLQKDGVQKIISAYEKSLFTMPATRSRSNSWSSTGMPGDDSPKKFG